MCNMYKHCYIGCNGGEAYGKTGKYTGATGTRYGSDG